jgi:hypothetical protein
MSEQMRKLTFDIIGAGMHNAVDSFPDLEVISPAVLEQLTSFLAVNIVSSVIQERAHMLATAEMLADVLPQAQAEGLHKFIELQMGLIEGGVDKM